jgi:hypothetical protein
MITFCSLVTPILQRRLHAAAVTFAGLILQQIQQASLPTFQLAMAVDRFLRAAGPLYNDADILLQLDEEPTKNE